MIIRKTEIPDAEGNAMRHDDARESTTQGIAGDSFETCSHESKRCCANMLKIVQGCFTKK